MTQAIPESWHSYPASRVRGDYLRAFAGAAFCGFPFLVIPVHTVAAVILGGLTLLFAGYGARTWLRTIERVVMDDTGLSVGVLYRRHLTWQELAQLKLRYFSTNRDRSGGWMQLVLRGKGISVGIDSEIEGFVDICRRARDAARSNGLTLNEPTIRNFFELDIDAEDMAVGSDKIVKKEGWGSPANWRR